MRQWTPTQPHYFPGGGLTETLSSERERRGETCDSVKLLSVRTRRRTDCICPHSCRQSTSKLSLVCTDHSFCQHLFSLSVVIDDRDLSTTRVSAAVSVSQQNLDTCLVFSVVCHCRLRLCNVYRNEVCFPPFMSVNSASADELDRWDTVRSKDGQQKTQTWGTFLSQRRHPHHR